MARFVSKYRGHSIVVRPSRSVPNQITGERQNVQEPLICDFRPGAIYGHEIDEALVHFNFGGNIRKIETEQWAHSKDAVLVSRTESAGGGLGHGEDPSQRLAVFDTEIGQKLLHWSDEDRLFVEKRLREKPENGTDYIEIIPTRMTPPWPNYGQLITQGRRTIDLVVEKIIDKVREDGYNPLEVAAYERENLNRAEVHEALMQLAKEEQQPEVEEIILA